MFRFKNYCGLISRKNKLSRIDWPKTLFLAAAKLTKPGLKVCSGFISRGFDQRLARAAKPCQNSAKPAKTQRGFAAFRGSFARVSRHSGKMLNPVVNKGNSLFYKGVLSVSRQGVAFSD